jgi:hypothetical protein
MDGAKQLTAKLQPWFEARRRFKLSNAHIQMAREMGMNPKKFGSLDNHRQELWKAPLPDFIAECYRKRFGRSAPVLVRSLEEIVQADRQKREEKQARKTAQREAEAAASGEPAVPAVANPADHGEPLGSLGTGESGASAEIVEIAG